MIVGRRQFLETLETLSTETKLAVDTETTGLRPYHNDKLFSIIISSAKEDYYFNFHDLPYLDRNWVLGRESLLLMSKLFADPTKTWYGHNLPFDLGMLYRAGIHVAGPTHCTQAQARLVYNEHFQYSLDKCGERIGFKKDPKVEQYITRHRLWTKTPVPGKKTQRKNKHYDQVPFDLITTYGQRDGRVCFEVGADQERRIDEYSKVAVKGMPTMRSLSDNERRLTNTIFRMERVGVKIDSDYVRRAAGFEQVRSESAAGDFKTSTGHDFKNSGKLFSEIFSTEKDRWGYTDKGNPSFDSDNLKQLQHPAAKHVLTYRDAKSKKDFYEGFLFHADSDHIIHPHFNAGGTGTGRLSSSNPNFQNLTKARELDQEFIVRRAIIPRPGNVFLMPDYDQMEYRMMLDYAADLVGHSTPLVEAVLGGLDVHTATAQIANITRDQAKTTNFLTLYGGGNEKLAAGLGCSVQEASRIRGAIFRSAPEIPELIRVVTLAAKRRGYIFNWAGRRSYFPDRDFAYKSTNYLVQGGCADVTKYAMTRIEDFLGEFRCRGVWVELVLTIHDELVIECQKEYAAMTGRKVISIMENVYPHKYVPLTVGMEHSFKSLADKVPGLPEAA